MRGLDCHCVGIELSLCGVGLALCRDWTVTVWVLDCHCIVIELSLCKD